jgi:hypothetical protein
MLMGALYHRRDDADGNEHRISISSTSDQQYTVVQTALPVCLEVRHRHTVGKVTAPGLKTSCQSRIIARHHEN